ncbi:MAG TPA: hypothetical protein VJX67_15180 [Blastocatellia bacterium]|nr:hypothetical protein [Blastocatellia bacterium]
MRGTVSTNFIDSPGLSLPGQLDTPTVYKLVFIDAPTVPTEMSLVCRILLEGGGANRTIGVSQIQLGDLGNLTKTTAQVNYATSGTATENPGGPVPMVDGEPPKGVHATGGDTPFRSNSEVSQGTGAGGNGVDETVVGDDHPGFGPWNIVHPNGHKWRPRRVGMLFTEFIVGYSTSFPQYYVAFAKGSWTLTAIGNNGKNGWVDGGSSASAQGQPVGKSQPITILENGGSAQPVETAGAQVLGLSYATNFSFTYSK